MKVLVARSIQQILMMALLRLEDSPDLSSEEVEQARRLALRLMTDITLAKSERAETSSEETLAA